MESGRDVGFGGEALRQLDPLLPGVPAHGTGESQRMPA